MGNPFHPVWQDEVEKLFSEPYWIAEDRRKATGEGWRGCMAGYGIQLGQYDSVKQWATLIYHYLHSREMPLAAEEEEYWPEQALEQLRAWVNDGFRRTASDPIVPREILPKPVQRPVTLRVRRDIRSLSQAELDDYRRRLDDVLQVGNASPDSPGQVFARIHGDWCLHYQEAFLLWHRAYLMQFEQAIGCAVPYWNWYAADASVDGRPDAGIPQAFKDLAYIHPVSGEERPNPLRFAAALGGRSKACADGAGDRAIDCRWVRRDPVLYTSGDERRAEREKKIGLVLKYQEQIRHALAFDAFSTPQGWPGFPWANITSFEPPPPDSEYVYRDVNFDGAYEQPHDNFHGWVGPDMADNAYTAFDPIFWSYHANIDRVFEMWLRSHPAATCTSNYPVRPFSGAFAERLELDDPRRFVYTTIGDLAKDSRALGYDYADPVDPDFSDLSRPGAAAAPARSAALPAGAVGPPQADEDRLHVRFEGVRCVFHSYAIDAFLNLDHTPTLQDVDVRNPHYIGRSTRLGMGVEDDKGRCIAHGITRLLDATPNARALGLAPGDPCVLSLLVTDLATGRAIEPAEWRDKPGFEGKLVWSRAGWFAREPGGSAPASCRRGA